MKITDARQLNWRRAHESAARIVKHCEGAGFIAPDALDAHQRQIQLICRELDAIVTALHIEPPRGRERMFSLEFSASDDGTVRVAEVGRDGEEARRVCAARHGIIRCGATSVVPTSNATTRRFR